MLNHAFKLTVLAITTLSLLTACSSSHKTQPTVFNPAKMLDDTYYLYVSAGGDKRIATYKLNIKNGKLTPASSITLPGSPGSLSIAPDQKHLYAALRSTKSIATLKINHDTGKLTKVAVTPAVSNPVYILATPSGNSLITAYYAADKAAVYTINKQGHVLEGATQVFEMDDKPHSIMLDPSAQFAFVPNTGADTIHQFKWNAAQGILTYNKPKKITTPKGEGPRHFTFHPSLPVVYFINEIGSSVSVATLDQSKGTLKLVQNLPTLPPDFTTRNTTADIHITPNGKFLYATNRGHDSLAAYAVNPKTGRITFINRYPTEKIPREFDIDPTGRFLYAAGQRSGKLAAYTINQTDGSLTHFATYNVGKSPAWVTILRLPKK